MDNVPFFAEHGQLSFRWLHLIAGVLWIGVLWFFNWINGAFVGTLDGETKKKVVPELMPRALFWFRWGAAWTWITGVCLMFVMYYIGGKGHFFSNLSEMAGEEPTPAQWGIPFASLFVGFIVYDLIFKTVGKANHLVGVLLWGGIAIAFGYVCNQMLDMSARASYIHVGALFGTSMAANVWMRIWPAQKRIITATKNGEAPDPADPALAGLRSKHNTYMSVPLLLFMVAVDQGPIIGVEQPVIWIAVTLVVGFLMTFAIYKKVPSVKGF